MKLPKLPPAGSTPAASNIFRGLRPPRAPYGVTSRGRPRSDPPRPLHRSRNHSHILCEGGACNSQSCLNRIGPSTSRETPRASRCGRSFSATLPFCMSPMTRTITRGSSWVWRTRERMTPASWRFTRWSRKIPPSWSWPTCLQAGTPGDSPVRRRGSERQTRMTTTMMTDAVVAEHAPPKQLTYAELAREQHRDRLRRPRYVARLTHRV